MRTCPVCNVKLNDYNYFFCTNCQTALPQGLFRLPKPLLLNLKLKYEINPTTRFLFFQIPYENRFSATIISFLFFIFLVLILGIVINSYFKLWL